VEFILRNGPELKWRIDDRGHNGDKIVLGMVRICRCAVNGDWRERGRPGALASDLKHAPRTLIDWNQEKVTRR
jgi:hypothetical protein